MLYIAIGFEFVLGMWLAKKLTQFLDGFIDGICRELLIRSAKSDSRWGKACMRSIRHLSTKPMKVIKRKTVTGFYSGD